MGYLAAADMATTTDLRTALHWHLQANHYPAIPVTMIDPCLAAIDAMNDDDGDAWIDLPDGISWRGRTQAPAWAIAEAHHLSAFIDDPWED